MILEGMSSKAWAATSMISGVGTVFAQALPVPDGWSSWSTEAILGFITLAALGVLVLKMRQDTEVAKTTSTAIEHTATAIQNLAVTTSESHMRQEQTNASLQQLTQVLSTKPCMYGYIGMVGMTGATSAAGAVGAAGAAGAVGPRGPAGVSSGS